MVKSLFRKSIINPAKMETKMILPGFFDLNNHLSKIDSNEDPLTK